MAFSNSQGWAEDRGADDDDEHDDDVWALTLALAAAFAAAGWLVLFTAPEEDRHGVRLVSAVVLFVLASVLALRGIGRKEMADGVSSLRPVISRVLEPLDVPRSEWELPALVGLYQGYQVTVSTSEALAIGTSYYSPASYSVSITVPWTSPEWMAVSHLCGFDNQDVMLKRAVRRAVADVSDERTRQGARWPGPWGEPHIDYRRSHGYGEICYTVARRGPLVSLTSDDFEEQVELLIRVARLASAAITQSM